MGFVSKAVGGFLGKALFGWGASKVVKKVLTPKITVPRQEIDIPAPPAPPAPVAIPQQETGVDKTGMQIKRKAKGKRGLMIQPTNTTGGGSVGTGLNI